MAESVSTMPEEWRPVVGYERLYEVSSLGRVRSQDRTVVIVKRDGREERRTYTGQVLRPYPHIADYPQVKLSRDGKIKNRFVHVLVCEAWHGPRPMDHQAAHRDGNRQNCRPSNLRWASRSENEQDKLAHGTRVRGERTPNSVLTAELVGAIRGMADRGFKPNAIAEVYGLSASTVSNVVSGRNWAWLQ